MTLMLNEINKAISVAYNAMLGSTDNAVSYFYRIKIYQTFMSDNKSKNERIYKRLALISARYVLPIWTGAKINDKRPEYLLDLAENSLFDSATYKLLQHEAGLFWDFMEEFGNTEEAFSIGNAFYAGSAVSEAAMEVLGKVPYENLIVNENDSDSDIDISCGDTVFWAASAFAGRIGYPNVSREKNKLFWTWWLKEAIPESLLEV